MIISIGHWLNWVQQIDGIKIDEGTFGGTNKIKIMQKLKKIEINLLIENKTLQQMSLKIYG